MTIRTVIYDWDGTLARTLDLWVQGYHAAFGRRAMAYDAATIVAEFFQDHHSVPVRHPHLDFATIAGEVRAHVIEAVAGVTLYDGALAVVDAVRARGLAVALVSSSPRAALERGLAAHDLAGRFASIIAGDDGFGHKPDTAPFPETLRRLDAQAATTLVVGDSHIDMLAGRALGCRTCWFTPPENRLFQPVALEADHRLTAWEDLLHHV